MRAQPADVISDIPGEGQVLKVLKPLAKIGAG